MVETITPVVHGGRRGWARAVAWHVLAATAASGGFGAALGLAGRMLGAPWGAGGALALAVVASAYAARELLGVPVPVPQLRRQVPDWWRTFFGPRASAALYGAGLGIGFLSYLRRAGLIGAAALAAGWGDPALGAAVVAPFGLARGITVLVAGRVRRREDGPVLVASLAGRAAGPWWRGSSGVALLALAIGAARASAGPVRWGDLAAAAIAVAFAWAALSKAFAWERWRRALAGLALPAALARPAATGVPLAEAAVAILVQAGLDRAAGLVALAMLVAFSAVPLRSLVRGERTVGCGCFGGTRPVAVRAALARNAALALGAVVAASVGRNDPVALAAPGAQDALPAVLAVAGVGLAMRTAVRGLGALRGRW